MAGVVSDLFLTDAFLVKGTVAGKSTRISKFLDEYPRQFLAIHEATMVDLKSHQRIETPRVYVNLDEVVFAHEFLDIAGDFYQKTIAKDREAVRIRAFYSGSVNFELAGRVRPKAYETDDVTKRFFVMEAPQIRGLDLEEDQDLAVLKNLPYIVVNKTRLAYIYDFNA